MASESDDDQTATLKRTKPRKHRTNLPPDIFDANTPIFSLSRATSADDSATPATATATATPETTPKTATKPRGSYNTKKKQAIATAISSASTTPAATPLESFGFTPHKTILAETLFQHKIDHNEALQQHKQLHGENTGGGGLTSAYSNMSPNIKSRAAAFEPNDPSRRNYAGSGYYSQTEGTIKYGGLSPSGHRFETPVSQSSPLIPDPHDYGTNLKTDLYGNQKLKHSTD